jgi:hypothetical protein
MDGRWMGDGWGHHMVPLIALNKDLALWYCPRCRRISLRLMTGKAIVLAPLHCCVCALQYVLS